MQNIAVTILIVLVLGLLTVILTLPISARAALHFKLPQPYLTATTTVPVSHFKK